MGKKSRDRHKDGEIRGMLPLMKQVILIINKNEKNAQIMMKIVS